jgi:hypothetical protein
VLRQLRTAQGNGRAAKLSAGGRLSPTLLTLVCLATCDFCPTCDLRFPLPAACRLAPQALQGGRPEGILLGTEVADLVMVVMLGCAFCHIAKQGIARARRRTLARLRMGKAWEGKVLPRLPLDDPRI